MSREWKPGEAVTATVNGRPNVRLIAGWSKYEPQLRWCELSPRWADGDDDECWFMPSQVTDARPLVVIDPENSEQVEWLWRIWTDFAPDHRLAQDNMQAALREFANPTPPKPEEPSGLGAVVVDSNNVTWVLAGRDLPTASPDNWRAFDGPCVGDWQPYHRINAVRVLSEGVTR